MPTYTEKQLLDIFNRLELSLYNSYGNSPVLKKNLKYFKNVKFQKHDDNWYYHKIVEVTFYSGFKAQTVTNKLDSILETFNSINSVSRWSEYKLDSVYKNKDIIQNKSKIRSSWLNAKTFNKIISEFGSFYLYLKNFGDLSIDSNLESLRKDLIKKFHFIGEVTSYHFMTDLGLNVVKPDRVLVRIFKRLGLINPDEEDQDKLNFQVIHAARRIAEVTSNNMRYIDVLFVIYGQTSSKEMGIDSGICLEKHPICEKCQLQKYCNYFLK